MCVPDKKIKVGRPGSRQEIVWQTIEFEMEGPIPVQFLFLPYTKTLHLTAFDVYFPFNIQPWFISTVFPIRSVGQQVPNRWPK